MKNKLIVAVGIFVLINSGIYSQYVSNPIEAAGNNALKLNSNISWKTSGIKFIDGSCNSSKENLFTQVKSDINSSLRKSINNDLINFSVLKDSTNPEKVSTSTQKEKSVWLGMAFSAIIPGGGEFYAKNYLKAAIFFAVEAGLWGTYYYFQHTGDKKTNDFQNYANKYWDIHYYARWLIAGGFHSISQINPDETNWNVLQQEIIVCENDPQNPFSHTLPPYGQQQFYELIGKYQEFEAGWTNLQHPVDYSQGSPYYWESYHDPVWTAYSNSRQDANNYYNHGTTTVMIIILNHIASVADAAWTVTMFNRNLHVQTGVRLDTYITPFTYEYKTQPKFNLQVNF